MPKYHLVSELLNMEGTVILFEINEYVLVNGRRNHTPI